MKILIAEDNLMNQLLMKIYMNQLGWTYVIVENGLLAVESCKTGDFDFILMDIKMPVLDGIEATKLIRTFNTQIPIIAVTAHSEFHTRLECINAGMNEFIEKPFTGEQIQSVIARLSGSGS